jgi:hypothetical protein
VVDDFTQIAHFVVGVFDDDLHIVQIKRNGSELFALVHRKTCYGSSAHTDSEKVAFVLACYLEAIAYAREGGLFLGFVSSPSVMWTW